MLRLSDIRMKPKLVFLFLMTGAFPLIFVGWLGMWLASDALVEKSFAQLKTVQELKSQQIKDAFAEREDDLKTLANSKAISLALTELGRLSPATLNSNSSEYLAVRDRYRESLTDFIQTYDLHDLFLIEGETGRVAFATVTENIVGEKLTSGTLKSSGLSQIWQKVSAARHSSFVDFEPFSASYNMESAFMGVPVFAKGGKLLGVVAAQFSPTTFQAIIRTRSGLGETGETYIACIDAKSGAYEFRSSMETMGKGEYIIGRELSPPKYWREALAPDAHSAFGHYRDSTDTRVLVAYSPLHLYGLNWTLISKVHRSEILAPAYRLLVNLAIGGFIVLCMVAVGSYSFTRRIVHPIEAGVEFAHSIAEGDLSARLDLDQKDELGRLARTLNSMARNLRSIDWLKRGKEGLDDTLRGEADVTQMARRFITYFVKHLDAQLGAVYLRQEETDTLVLTAGYAFTDRRGNHSRIKIGEGLVGQAALEHEVLYFSNVDDQAPAMNFGADERIPPYFLAAPLELQNGVVGVALVGSMSPFTDNQRQLVEENIESVAIHFNTARSHHVIGELLEQAQEQAEALTQQREDLATVNRDLEDQAQALKASEAELQAQQEELRVTNEELEEQTKALKASEEKLQSQQEELRVTNEELEERTKALEKQRNAIRKKNIDLLRAQDLIEQRARDLEIASKYKSEFLANMSHELRTPLNSILILSQLLADNASGNLTDKQTESASAIHSSGADLLALINEILDLSKVESGLVELEAEDAPLNRITEDLRRVFREIAEDKGVTFNVAIEEGLSPSITTDPQRVQQVLRNLISNAFKFTENGSVTLRISRPDENANLDASGLNREDALAFSVTDTGIGIPDDKQAVIFEAFQQADGTTSRKYGGTGLGLSISRELAKFLGGELQLVRSDETGSCFTLFLPEVYTPPQNTKDKDTLKAEAKASRARARKTIKAKAKTKETKSPEATQETEVPIVSDSAPPEEAEQQTQETEPEEPTTATPSDIPDDRRLIQPGDRSLLIVEDDPNFAKVLLELAHERDFKCLIANDGETGLHFADYYRPSAIVLDVGLPGIDGWTVMERLKSNADLRHIPVHFMSSADETLDAMRMGAVGYLTKPVSVKAVNKALGRIEHVLSKPVKKLLVVEDDELQRKSIAELIGNGDVVTTAVDTGKKAFKILEKDSFDCMILDLGLKDMSGFDLLRKIRKNGHSNKLPIIIYTGRELTREEEEELQRHAESIIIKGARSPERLLDETTLFLHRVEANLPEDKQRMLRMVHDKEAILDGKKILLVDDDMRNVFALSSALEARGLEVIIARNGREGVEKLETNSDADLILMDIMMPEMDGYEAMRLIRKKDKHKDLPIIALTAKAMKGDRNKCIEAGASDYMAKPVEMDKLFSLLRVWLYR